MIKPWPTLSSRPLGDFRIFRLREDRRRSPRTGGEQDCIIIEARPWVNVIALTPDRRMVMVEQFRHGSETVELEIPGGVMDPADASPPATGERELREETGYKGKNARVIGSVWANPAILNNLCHTVLIEECRLTSQLALDDGEEIVTHSVPIDEVAQMVTAGRIRHSLVVAALHHFDLWRRVSRSGG